MQPDFARNIVACFVQVDDLLKTQSEGLAVKTGRPSTLFDSELLTMVIFGTLTHKARTFKDLWCFMSHYHQADFPNLPAYQNFVAHVHRVLPLMVWVLQNLLRDAPLRFLDSTKLPVCHLHRAERHQVARSRAAFGKNHQGWWYGFKLHAAIDSRGQLCAVRITPANVHDQGITPALTQSRTRIAVGDGGYRSSVMNRWLWEQRGVFVLTPPHYKQVRQVATSWQHQLVSMRAKIEAVFDLLKEHLPLVTSFPRSITGYLVHYVRVLLAYQFGVLGVS